MHSISKAHIESRNILEFLAPGIDIQDMEGL